MNLKDKSLFVQIISLIILAVVCLLLTASMAIMVGSLQIELFDIRNLNFSNMIPVILAGGFITCVVIGICVLFVGRNAFFKAKNYFDEKETKNENGGTKK